MYFDFKGIDWRKFNISGLIAEIKRTVPKDFRDYDPVTERWVVDEEYADAINRLLQDYATNPQSSGHAG